MESPMSFASAMNRMGVRATVRQLAAAAAIAWGTRSAISQAADAQELVSQAGKQLDDLYAKIDRASEAVASMEDDIDAYVTAAIDSGRYDSKVKSRYLSQGQPISHPEKGGSDQAIFTQTNSS